MDNVYRILRCWLQAWIELIMFLPILIFPAYYLSDSLYWILWLSSLTLWYVLGFLITALLRNKWRIYFYGIILLTVLMISYLLFSWEIALWVSVPIFIFASFRGRSCAIKDDNTHFPAYLYTIGLLIYFFIYGVIALNASLRDTFPITDYISVMGVIALLLSLFLGNKKMIASEYLTGKSNKMKVSPQILKHNRVFMGVFFLLCFAVASLQKIQSFLLYLRDQLAAWLAQFNMGGTEEPPPQETPQNQDSEWMEGIEQGEPSLFWIIFERIAIVLVYVFVIAVVILAIWYGGKALIRLGQRLMKWIRSKIGMKDQMEMDLGYDDERESLFDIKKITKSALNKMKTVYKTKEKWSDQRTNADKVRFLYRDRLYKVIRKGYSFKSQLTPSETTNDINQWKKEMTVNDELLHAYHRTRYGKQEIDQETVERLKRQSGDFDQ